MIIGGVLRTGYTEEELSRISLFDLVPEEEKEGVERIFKDLLNGVYPNTHENHWLTKYGEKKFIAWTNTVVPDKEGGVENIISTGIDITEQRNEMENRVKQLEAEIARMESYSSPGPTNVTGRMYSQKMIRENKPGEFGKLIETYESVLDDRLEERMYKTDKSISFRLQSLARRLGIMEAGPKDVVEIHVTALRNLSSGVNYKRAKALTEEGRLLAMELMGYLVSFYRNQVSFESGDSKANSNPKDGL
ncbi:MAG: PAS domain-containing protein [Spirochaetia bacterium]